MSAAVSDIHSPNGITTNIAMISPELAAKWLLHNQRNRTASLRSIEAFSDAMSKGEWQLNGEAIKFGSDGTLLDGQTRLMACIHSGTSFRSFVVHGLPPVTQESMDMGTARSPGDVLTLHRVANANQVAAAARFVIIWSRWRWFGNTRSKFRVSHHDVLRFAKDEKGFIEFVRSSRQVAGKCYMPPSVVLGTWYILHGIDADAADQFFRSLSDGAGLSPDSPILALRNRLIDAKSRSIRLPYASYVFLIFRAWNAFRSGQSMRRIPLPSGSVAESIPEPI